MSLLVRVNGRRVNHTGLNYSSVRRGGYEQCAFSMNNADLVMRKGMDVRVYDGLRTVWNGFVNDVGPTHDKALIGTSYNVTALGYGSKLKLSTLGMIFVDRDPSHWSTPNLNRKLGAIAVHDLQDGTIDAGGLDVGLDGPTARQKYSELYYLLPEGMFATRVRFDWDTVSAVVNVADANWVFEIWTVNRDGYNQFSQTVTIDNGVATSSVQDYQPATKSGGIMFRSGYAIATAGQNHYPWTARYLSVYGDHGLTVRDTGRSDTAGILAIDILEYAVKVSGAGFDITNLGGPTGNYKVMHSAYLDPVEHEQIVEDMAKILGWSYGTWEPSSVLSNQPSFTYGADPASITSIVQYDDCQDPDISDSLMEQADKATVVYTDVSGLAKREPIIKENLALPTDWHREVLFNIGTSETPDVHGLFLLALQQDGTRARGTVRLPDQIFTPGGGRRGAHTLKPGRERLAILGLPNVPKRVGDATALRGDTFSISRLSVTEDDKGDLSVVAEVDTGADLTETLNARFESERLANGVA